MQVTYRIISGDDELLVEHVDQKVVIRVGPRGRPITLGAIEVGQLVQVLDGCEVTSP